MISKLTNLAAAAALLSSGAVAQSCPFLDPNAAPITYTTSSFLYKGQAAWCYNMGEVITSEIGAVPANYAIQPVNSKGEVVGGLIFDSTPCDAGSSPLYIQLRIVVPDGTPADFYTNYTGANATGDVFDNKDGAFNLVIVPVGSIIKDTSGGSNDMTTPQVGWYNGQPVYYFSFGSVPFFTDNTYAWAGTGKDITVVIDSANGGAATVGSAQLLDVTHGDRGYTGFYSKYSYEITSATAAPTSADAIGSAAALLTGAPILNCPFSSLTIAGSALSTFSASSASTAASASSLGFASNPNAVGLTNFGAVIVPAYISLQNTLQSIYPDSMKALQSCTAVVKGRDLTNLRSFVTKAQNWAQTIAVTLQQSYTGGYGQQNVLNHAYHEMQVNVAKITKIVTKIRHSGKTKACLGY
ncbi:hypothetical protein HK101_001830 [Irineochytrium annulatum]|nr:hypothetical protein HK101_001830 [Irineochytrium annulatum]